MLGAFSAVKCAVPASAVLVARASILGASAAIGKSGIPTASSKSFFASVSKRSFTLKASTRTFATHIVNPANVDPKSVMSPPPSGVEPPMLPAAFRLKSGQSFECTSFGAPITKPVTGEVVFTTSLVGYNESLTDPSYRGQILVFTQPLIGNYGVPDHTLDQFGLFENFESGNIQASAVVVNDYALKYSHWKAIRSLGEWCAAEGVPAITGVDTRAVVQILRGQGSTLGEITVGTDLASLAGKEFTAEDPNKRNLCAEVSTKAPLQYNKGGDVRIALVGDMGAKQNIIRCLAARGAEVVLLPLDHDFTKDSTQWDGIFYSNGPGDPKTCPETVNNLRSLLRQESAKEVPTPVFGICMGNLMMGMAAGFESYKLPFGNRGHNQPAINLTNGSCVITSQNHGYALKDDAASIPKGWERYFVNANDGSNEGIKHSTLPFASVQFHPEACAGPQDTEYLFDEYLAQVRASKLLRTSANVAARILVQEAVAVVPQPVAV
ncbi:small subunit of carbamoyl phosphate synthase [Gonapodya prolifera JEL478]|uniref:Carbamoyl phosphate synthase arginine-specific small chain n=1 Tax=Gonapodya prolifera (strain JEL478) TaxID=1344416 RepID=A0A138ZYZ9_GONPJ|nr:small subunit of carbamoyl phosphate synthase [Gonapodya prolifera JEL478]|eukprot:KXS09734.1 small subunit of carbamoyl phosphate synthase [Gonapodya prolifera JEL478]